MKTFTLSVLYDTQLKSPRYSPGAFAVPKLLVGEVRWGGKVISHSLADDELPCVNSLVFQVLCCLRWSFPGLEWWPKVGGHSVQPICKPSLPVMGNTGVDSLVFSCIRITHNSVWIPLDLHADWKKEAGLKRESGVLDADPWSIRERHTGVTWCSSAWEGPGKHHL